MSDQNFIVVDENNSISDDEFWDAILSSHIAIVNAEPSVWTDDEAAEALGLTDNKFNPNQPRDSRGRFGSGGGTAGPGSAFVTEPSNPNGDDTYNAYRKPDGSWTEERRQLHQKILDETMSGKTPVVGSQPIAYVMGGGPAAGKSSALRDGGIIIPDNTVHIDSDQIKAKIPEYDNMVSKKNPKSAAFVHEESSAVSKELQKRASSGGYNTLLDGTGDSSIESLESKIVAMKDSGQRVVAHYVTVDTETAVKRSNARAEKTGRVVPEAVVRATHASVSRVLPEALQRGLFDEVTLWDTNGSKAKAIMSARGSEVTIHDASAWNKFVAKGE